MKQNQFQKAKTPPDPFRDAVAATDDLKGCFRKGLKALGAHSAKIDLANTRLCSGSVFIDGCLSSQYPDVSRWDYLFSYKGKIYFIEVHPAQSSEVDEMIKKLNWLKHWLNTKAPAINKLKATDTTPYYWVATSGVNLPAHTRQYRKAASAGLLPVSKISLK